MSEPPKEVGVWVRNALLVQAGSSAGIDLEKQIGAFVAANGWRTVETYLLYGATHEIAEHPEAERLLADVRTGRIRSLVLADVNQLGRSNKDLRPFFELFEEKGVELISFNQTIDFTSATGRSLAALIAKRAELEEG